MPPIQKQQQQAAATVGVKTPEIKGVFSTQEVRKVGTGTTTRKSVHKSFWFVEQHGDEIECQPLNTNYVPSGPKRKVTMDELIAKFSPEPEFYMNSVFPKMQELNTNIKNGDDHREKGETFAAELEYNRALKIDCDNVRANFGIGITYLERGDNEKAQNIFDRLVNLEGAFEDEHKHLFNEFGINLRKNKMLKQSLAYYQRALDLSKNDENLFMNMARVQLESKDSEGCVENLLNALKLAPSHDPSLKFLAWMMQKKLVPDAQIEPVKAAIQNGVHAARAAAAPKMPDQPKTNADQLLQNVEQPQAAAAPQAAAQPAPQAAQAQQQ